MGVPCRARAGLEAHPRRSHARRRRSLDDRILEHGPGERVARHPARRPCSAGFDMHAIFLRRHETGHVWGISAIGSVQLDLAKPYSVSGLVTRTRWRVAASGAHSDKRSNSTASFGFSFSVGCGQSLPHTIRSGAAFTKAWATLLTSA